MASFSKTFDFTCRRDHQKNFDYESVDEKTKNDEKSIQEVMG